MKKIVTLLLTLTIAGVLCACGGRKESSNFISDALGMAAGQTQKNIEAEILAEIKEEMNIPESTEEESKTEKKYDDVEFNPTIIVDNDRYRVEATDATWTKKDGYEVNFVFENKTDTDLEFSIDNAGINGWMVSASTKKDVSAGKKTNGTLEISTKSIEKYEFDDITRITFTLGVNEDNDWFGDTLEKTTATIYPRGQEADKDYGRKSLSSDDILMDNEDFTFIITEKKIDNKDGYVMKVYTENKSDDRIYYELKDITINDYMFNLKWYDNIAPHLKAYGEISIDADTLEEQRLTPDDVNEIEGTLHLIDRSNGYEEMCEQTFTIKTK